MIVDSVNYLIVFAFVTVKGEGLIGVSLVGWSVTLTPLRLKKIVIILL